jgi:hypothetical protein
MSPVGRVFIVLNLVLAGGFAYVSGTYLQKQDNYKKQLEAANKAHAEKTKAFEQQITQLEGERNTFENAKTANGTSLPATKNQLVQREDENKLLQAKLSSVEGDVKKLTALAEAANTESKAAFERAKLAYDQAIADQKTRDDAVNAKNAAEPRTARSRRRLRPEETVKHGPQHRQPREAKSELNPWCVAVANGFSPAMAAPNPPASSRPPRRLLTIQITDNRARSISDQIAKRPFNSRSTMRRLQGRSDRHELTRPAPTRCCATSSPRRTDVDRKATGPPRRPRDRRVTPENTP